MKNTGSEKKAMAAYRELLQKEIARPRVAEEKRAFIAGHFRPSPVWMPGLEALAPAAVLVCLFLFFHFQTPAINLQPAKLRSQPEPNPISSLLPQAKTPIINSQPAVKPRKKYFRPQGVWVKKVTSQVGQPMIYQKKINQKPVTVVWVFTKPGIHA